ncbi:coiled-coil domain-containing protein 162-like [Antennarius striatus]|uniref:coiled-coil domain-containing protein 162-like n=1 Tax=Antennarius striatus TaxID=241820 RepID=UPI0035AE2166
MMDGNQKEMYAVGTFSKLLELVTIRHRLLELAAETEQLAQLYQSVASQLGFDDLQLYLRPVPFEVAEQRVKEEQRTVFITAVLQDDGSVDKSAMTHLPLSIQELDPDQIGKFSFSSEEAVVQLMNGENLENLQVTLACQVTQKNALLSAVKLACVCRWSNGVTSSDDASVPFDPSSRGSATIPTTTKERLREAFVSIQLEKVSLRDEMVNAFLEKKRTARGDIKHPEEAAAVKRNLIINFLKKFSSQMSQHCVRAQIIEYYYNLTFLLDHIPAIRQSHFIIGRAAESTLDSGADLCPDPRTFQRRPQQLLSADGKTLLNLWFIPHFSQVLHMFKRLDVLECAAGLHHTLQIVSSLHDIVYYLVSFSRLGNTQESTSCRVRAASLAADWGGAEGIGAELLEIQRQVDRLSNPTSPESAGRLLQLRRQVLLLQFDTAVRHLIREAFLASGDVISYQGVSDNMATALPLLSDSSRPDAFSVTLPVPPPLDAGSRRAQRMYAWRSFIACHSLLPLHIWNIPPIEYCMQLCLSSLSDRSRLQANAAILGATLLMEDVLTGEGEAAPVHLHGDKDKFLSDGEPSEEDELDPGPGQTRDPIRIQSVLKGFLLLTKQLQAFKESWARRRFGVQVFSVNSLYQQFMKLYRVEIFYPSMRDLAKQMGKLRDYELLISGSQALIPPPGASEVDVKTWQLHKLLESTECDMIRALQRRIGRDLTLVVSERTRQDGVLPTELWKKTTMKYSLSHERPQIVETFIHQLMEGAEEDEGQLRFCRDHLQRCLVRLGCSVMERERRSFLLYSQFYEQILQQETQLLHQREQDIKNLKDSESGNSHQEVLAVCRGMMLEVSALRVRVAQLEQEKETLEEQLSLKFRERYDPLVRHLYCTCIQLKARLDECRLQMEEDVIAAVNRARSEGVDRFLQLKKKYGCSTDSEPPLAQFKREELQELQQENRQLTALVQKLKALNGWRRLVDQEKLQRRLLQSQQREVSCRVEALRLTMTSEGEAALLQEELEAVRKELERCQAEGSSTKKMLSKKTEELQTSRHHLAQEARSRQELDSYRVQRLEAMRADVEDRERSLRTLGEKLDRDNRMNELQRQRSAKEIRQVRNQLQQELSLKQEAFQQVERLQNRVKNSNAGFSSGTAAAGLRKLSRQQSTLRCGSATKASTLQDVTAEPRLQRAETARIQSGARIERPKTVSETSRLNFNRFSSIKRDKTCSKYTTVFPLNRNTQPYNESCLCAKYLSHLCNTQIM